METKRIIISFEDFGQIISNYETCCWVIIIKLFKKLRGLCYLFRTAEANSRGVKRLRQLRDYNIDCMVGKSQNKLHLNKCYEKRNQIVWTLFLFLFFFYKSKVKLYCKLTLDIRLGQQCNVICSTTLLLTIQTENLKAKAGVSNGTLAKLVSKNFCYSVWIIWSSLGGGWV